MDKQKEIEKMAKVMCAGCCRQVCTPDNGCVVWKGAERAINAGYRLCGGDNCPNFKHYQAECERCTKKMEIKKALEIDAIKQQTVREFAERLKEQIASQIMVLKKLKEGGFISQSIRLLEDTVKNIDELVKEVCGE